MLLDADDLLACIRQDFATEYELSSLRLQLDLAMAEIARLQALVDQQPFSASTRPYVGTAPAEEGRHV